MRDDVLRNFLTDSGLGSRSQLSRLPLGERELAQALVRQGILSEDEVRRTTARALGIPFIELTKHDLSPEALMLIPEPLSRMHGVVGYKITDEGLELALLDLAALEALEPLRPQIGKRLLPRLTSSESLKRALLHYQHLLRDKFAQLLLQEREPARIVAHLLSHAVARAASAVHIDPSGASTRIRERVAGVLHDAMMLPMHVKDAVGKALPKEGRVSVDLGAGRSITTRVAHMPGTSGRRTVIHMEGMGVPLESLGLHGQALEALHYRLARRRGLIVVSGPDGAGKTTFLRTLQAGIESPHISLVQADDAPYLRAALRADPDVIVSDGVSTLESAALLQSAAARGILSLASTQEPELLPKADLTVGLALVRRLCAKQFPHKQKLSRDEQTRLEAHADFAKVLSALKEEDAVGKDVQWKDVTFARATPCSECHGGYDGLIGLQEVSAPGFETLTILEDGLFKAARGLTSLEEVLGLLQ